jgi:phage gpG-like protein
MPAPPKKPEKYIEDKDTGYAELATRFRGKGANVFVGFLQSSGVYKPKGERGGKPITVAQVAAIHEFGSSDGRIPQRSFMGSTIDEKDRELQGVVAQLLRKVIGGELSEVRALGIVGQKVKDWFRAKITAGLKPALSPRTIARKGPGKEKPLIDTGQLLGSITFQVRKGK